MVSSQEIGEMLGLKASQVRKDLSYFGEIGKRGVGYHVDRLYEHISEILSPPRRWRIGLVGAGKLGTALLGYRGFCSDKFCIEAIFDVDASKVGQEVGGIPCYHVDDIAEILAEKKLEVLILTIPAMAAQAVVDKAVVADTVRGILSFAPTTLVVPEGVLVYGVDISVELEKLLFYMKHEG